MKTTSLLDLESVRAFVKVAELGSFTRAAEQLGAPKSRVSLRVKALEDELGTRLLQRTTRDVAVTPDGEQLLPRARSLVAEAEAVSTLFSPSAGLRGRVRIDLPIALAAELVVPRLPELLAPHPELELVVSTTDRRVDLVREGFDVVLRVGRLADSGLVAKRLGSLALVSCASPGYLRRFGTPRTVADLGGHRVVAYASGSDDGAAFEYRRGSKVVEVPMRASVTVNSTSAYRAAAIAGLGIVQAPRYGLTEALRRGELVEVLPDVACDPLPVSLVHAPARELPPRVRVVMAWLAEVVSPAFTER